MSGKDYISAAELDGPIKPFLHKTLNRFIRALRSVFSVHCFMTGGHSKNSYHYKGLAADGHKGSFSPDRKPTDADIQIMASNLRDLLAKVDKTLFEQAVLARIAGFSGIGMYPDWKPTGGLHLDCRETNYPITNTIAWLGLNKAKLKQKIDESKSDQIYIYLR